ncbi:YolD-like family protein [Staphylococcus pseudintermedius]|uniref:YolD-like family protein n=1 Tax=Staphylococcus pseudintermedius TaxID=283734 RepID=UPI000A4D5AE3
MLPKKYANETDYRKIPRKYLNPNIPQGRGMKKWLPMATIPEQYEQLEQFIKDQSKVPKPSQSEDQILDINNTIVEKMFNNPSANIKYYHNGNIKKFSGTIHKINTENNALYIYNDKNNMIVIPLPHIYSVD